MSIDNVIQEARSISNEINELHKKRQELDVVLREKYTEEIRSLKWAKGIKFGYQEGIAAYGFKEHNLYFTVRHEDSKPFEAVSITLFGGINVLGDNKDYMKNLVLKKTDFVGHYQLSTCNPDILIEFLDKSGGKIDNNYGNFAGTVTFFERLAKHAI